MKTRQIPSKALAIMAFVCLPAFAYSQGITVKWNVLIPATTPAKSRVYLAGNHPALGDWDPGRVELRKESDSLWTYTAKFPKAFRLEWKITRGSWNNQAIYEQGVIPGNAFLDITKDTILIVRPRSWSDFGIQRMGRITGTVRYHRKFKGKGLQHDRDVIVWLPPSYARKIKQRFPVLYMHDGQNVFDPTTSFIGADWQVDEVADSLIKASQMEECIIVAIYNSSDRVPEYSDSELGRNYAKFVVTELKPFIDRTYRTRADAPHTGVMGSSMGGLCSFLFAWWYPEVFSKAGCLSSAFLFDNDKILKEVKSYGGPRKRIRIYMDCGGRGMEARLKKGMDDMRATLKEKGYKEGIDFEYFYDETAEHNEAAWAARVWRPLKFLYTKDKKD